MLPFKRRRQLRGFGEQFTHATTRQEQRHNKIPHEQTIRAAIVLKFTWVGAADI